MKPPVCAVCNKEFNPSEEGDLVSFKMRPSDKEWERKMRKDGMVGHPPYEEWFCDEHLKKAEAVAHLTIDVAMSRLHR